VESTLARLRNRARAIGYPAQAMLLLHLCERFLARVVAGGWGESLILKGGLNLYSRYREAARPTRDIDLAARSFQPTSDGAARVLRPILALDLDDGVTFLPATLTTEAILEDARYSGVRAHFVGTLTGSSTRATLQADLSFGNAIEPQPVALRFPNALGLPDTELLGYALETIVAEKLAALVELGAATTRVKDVYDLHHILTHDPPAIGSLAHALRATFARRGTTLAGSAGLVTTLQDEPGLARLWSRFLMESGLSAPPDLAAALEPLVEALEAALLEPGP
jgi:hypothetical protein